MNSTEPGPKRVGTSDADAKRAADLLDITQSVVDFYDDDKTAAQREYIVWTLLYMMWWESKSATTRIQDGGGPGRGLMQIEARTLTDLIKHYIRRYADDELPVLATAAGTTRQAIEAALRAFQTFNNGDTQDDDDITNVWPEPSTPPSANVAGLVSACLWDSGQCSDTFGVVLMREYFKHQAGQTFPYVAGKHPWDADLADTMFGQWRDYWKRVGGEPYKTQYQARMRTLNALLGHDEQEALQLGARQTAMSGLTRQAAARGQNPDLFSEATAENLAIGITRDADR